MKKNKYVAKYLAFFTLFGILIFSSCKDFVTVDPPTNKLVRTTVFDNDETAKSAIFELYAQMRNNNTSLNGVFFVTGLSSDELINLNLGDSYNEFFENSVLSTNSILPTIWDENFKQIYYANSIIEGLNKSGAVTANLKRQLIAEAKFVRGFCHFYLVNLFGRVPYITKTDYELNAMASRMPENEVYNLIIKDLREAKDELAINYSFSNGERIRPNKSAAAALLARTYLYAGDWVNAEIQATDVIANSQYNLCKTLDSVFLKNNSEAIWQFHQEEIELSTGEGNTFLGPDQIYFSKLNDLLIKSFDPLDLRKTSWTKQITVGTEIRFVPNKYKDFNGSPSDVPEYSTVLRLAEQYLIRAEARAQQNKLTGAASAESDLNTIRVRAGLSVTNASTQPALLLDISNQMRFEFFTEWGHRWIYLKHSGKADAVLGAIKSEWKANSKLYPIPYSETLLNPNMFQNPGY